MGKATIKLLIPFQGWCVEARGLHEHFSFLELFKAISRKARYNSLRTLCFCPDCDNELCGSDSYKFFRQTEKGDFEVYQCKKCNRISYWDFDSFPCPILKEDIH